MNVIAELRNINGILADVYIDNKLIFTGYNFISLPKEVEEKEEISLNKIIKLKEAGFDSDEILKMNQANML